MDKNSRYYVRFIKSIVALALILSIILESRSSAYGEHASGGETPALAASLGFIGLGLYDIATAWSSAVRYNESIGIIQPLSYSKYSHLFVSNKHSFGQVAFSRNMLGNSNIQPIIYQSEDLDKRLKSPQVALYWSAGATLIPTGIGILMRDVNPYLTAGIIIPSVLVGPSMGHFYADQWKRGTVTLIARVGLGLATIMLLICCT